jgi:hypothetical protein
VLLPRHSDALETRRIDALCVEKLGRHGAHGVDPRLRVLLAGAGPEPLQEAVGHKSAGDHAALLRIEHHTLGALGPDIEPEEEGHAPPGLRPALPSSAPS